jgi:hypothetical protein
VADSDTRALYAAPATSANGTRCCGVSRRNAASCANTTSSGVAVEQLRRDRRQAREQRIARGFHRPGR